MKEMLFGKTLVEIQSIVKELEMPAFSARQITDWLYKSDITGIEGMSNISAKNRARIAERFDYGTPPHAQVQVSSDGTKKYLYPTAGGRFIETAYIPETDRCTLCVSSQVGCKMGCLFCMTGKQGFQGNLTAGEIVNQYRSLPERSSITNIVYMGMGEPLDNTSEVLKSLEILTADWGYAMSPRRITVSTIGIIPGLKEFLEKSNCHLAISLHTPFDEERRKLLPVQSVYPIREVIELVKKYDWRHQRRISMEYIMFRELNDTPRHVNELARLLNGLKCRINLIRFHPIPDTPLKGTDDADIVTFRDALTAKGIHTTIRRSRGQDIYAACGLLSTKALVKPAETDF
jgi:23S rRNA (adenine2503-C2)-methyltransferase